MCNQPFDGSTIAYSVRADRLCGVLNEHDVAQIQIQRSLGFGGHLIPGKV